jgi:hypothetical protein
MFSKQIPNYYESAEGRNALEWMAEQEKQLEDPNNPASRMAAFQVALAGNPAGSQMLAGQLAADYNCKPFTDILNDFPGGYATGIMKYRYAYGPYENKLTDSFNVMASLNERVVFDYVVCRVEANIILTTVADDISQSGKVYETENDVSNKIEADFNKLDHSPDFTDRLMEKTDKIMKQMSCGGALPRFGKSSDFTLNCGTFYANAGSGEFRIMGRQTMSSSAIDGKSYKVSISQGNSESSGLSLESSDSTKDSTSTSTGSGVDTSSEFNRAK